MISRGFFGITTHSLATLALKSEDFSSSAGCLLLPDAKRLMPLIGFGFGFTGALVLLSSTVGGSIDKFVTSKFKFAGSLFANMPWFSVDASTLKPGPAGFAFDRLYCLMPFLASFN